MMEVFNKAAHDHLVGVLGYTHERVPEEWWEGGDAESGPRGLKVVLEHDRYTGPDERISVASDGDAWWEPRDLDNEAWLAAWNEAARLAAETGVPRYVQREGDEYHVAVDSTAMVERTYRQRTA